MGFLDDLFGFDSKGRKFKAKIKVRKDNKPSRGSQNGDISMMVHKEYPNRKFGEHIVTDSSGRTKHNHVKYRKNKW